MSPHGRLAVVTGAARGLGRSIALGLASAGARVVAVDRPGAAGLDAFDHAYGFDLADTGGLARLVDEIRPPTGRCTSS